MACLLSKERIAEGTLQHHVPKTSTFAQHTTQSATCCRNHFKWKRICVAPHWRPPARHHQLTDNPHFMIPSEGKTKTGDFKACSPPSQSRMKAMSLFAGQLPDSQCGSMPCGFATTRMMRPHDLHRMAAVDHLADIPSDIAIQSASLEDGSIAIRFTDRDKTVSYDGTGCNPLLRPRPDLWIAEERRPGTKALATACQVPISPAYMKTAHPADLASGPQPSWRCQGDRRPSPERRPDGCRGAVRWYAKPIGTARGADRGQSGEPCLYRAGAAGPH